MKTSFNVSRNKKQQRLELKKFIRWSMNEEEAARAESLDISEVFKYNWIYDDEWWETFEVEADRAYAASDKSKSYNDFEDEHEKEIRAAVDAKIGNEIELYRKNDRIIENLSPEKVRDYTQLRRLLEKNEIEIYDMESTAPEEAHGFVWNLWNFEGVLTILHSR